MKILTLRQGSPEWHQHRRSKFNASDAPAMLGESPHCTRSELLHRMATGLAPEVDAGTQRRFDAGHAVEALLRSHAESIVGEPLHPFVGLADFDDRLSASFDGCTFVGDEGAECKLLNARLRAAFADMENIVPERREQSAGKCLPIDYRIQMEQQARIAAARRVLFLTGELREDGTLGDVFSCWYYPDDALWARILGGWAQFEQDLAAYTPPAPAAAAVVASPVQSLPAVSVQVTGSITVVDNFAKFETALRDFLEHRLIREPKTDQDFADLDLQIKAMKGAEAALDAAEGQMLAQIEAVDTAAKAKAMLSKLVRDNRLMAEKLLAGEKERRRGEIVAGGVKALADHIAALNQRLGKPYMPAIPVDFGGAVKGLKSLASMEDKVGTELARGKIAANEVADRIQANLTTLRDQADFAFLFADTAAIVLKEPEDFRALVENRVAQHKAAEQKRLDTERERIRAEEAEKLAAEQRRKDAAEAARKVTEGLAEARRTEALPEPLIDALAEASSGLIADMAISRAAAPSVVPITRSKPAMKLGDINARIAPLAITAEGLERLGFSPAGKEGAAKLYHEADFGRMVDSMVAQLRSAAAGLPQAA